MAGYSGTPLAKKLGIKERGRVHVVGAPGNYRALLEPLSPSVQFVSEIDPTIDIVHVFATDRKSLAETLAAVRRDVDSRASVWISWPKKTAKLPTDVTEDTIRELALPLGFVDVKVCAIDDTWSGLKLVVRKKLR
ncbi:MAG TPA: DUF3052 family protein [Casimicrobiaceae bacterium]|nr:DUF3052 family protein [Casimicrobiaceae bacterium]